MDFYSSRAESQICMKELGQSDLTFLSYGSGCLTTPKNKKTQNFTLIQDMVKFKGPIKSQLCLKISKENISYMKYHILSFSRLAKNW